jgi:hypothetical protein
MQAVSLLVTTVKETEEANSRGIKAFDNPGQQCWIGCAKVVINCNNSCCDKMIKNVLGFKQGLQPVAVLWLWPCQLPIQEE